MLIHISNTVHLKLGKALDLALFSVAHTHQGFKLFAKCQKKGQRGREWPVWLRMWWKDPEERRKAVQPKWPTVANALQQHFSIPTPWYSTAPPSLLLTLILFTSVYNPMKTIHSSSSYHKGVQLLVKVNWGNWLRPSGGTGIAAHEEFTQEADS